MIAIPEGYYGRWQMVSKATERSNVINGLTVLQLDEDHPSGWIKSAKPNSETRLGIDDQEA